MDKDYADEEGHTYLHAALNAYAGYTNAWPLDLLESAKTFGHAFSKGAIMAAALYGMTYAAGHPVTPTTALALGVPLSAVLGMALDSVRSSGAGEDAMGPMSVVVDNLNYVMDTCFENLWAKSRCGACASRLSAREVTFRSSRSGLTPFMMMCSFDDKLLTHVNYMAPKGMRTTHRHAANPVLKRTILMCAPAPKTGSLGMLRPSFPTGWTTSL